MPAAAVSEIGAPGLSDCRAWQTDHLDAAATHWRSAATLWEQTFDDSLRGVASLASTEWTGEGSQTAFRRAHADRLTAIRLADMLSGIATLASRGSEQIRVAQRSVLEAVAEAAACGFRVKEDLSLTDTVHSHSQTRSAARNALGVRLATAIQQRAATLRAVDSGVAGRLMTATSELLASAPAADSLAPAPDSDTKPLNWGGERSPESPPVDVPHPDPGGGSVDDPVRKIAAEIAGGHAWRKHAATDFPGMTQRELEQKVYDILKAADSSVGRTPHGTMMVFRDGVVVIYDPRNRDMGTAFKPTEGYQYFKDGTVPSTQRVGVALPPEVPKAAQPLPLEPASPQLNPPKPAVGETGPTVRVGGVPIGGGPVPFDLPGLVDPRPANEPTVLGDDPYIEGPQ